MNNYHWQERPQHYHENRRQASRALIEPAGIATGKSGVLIKHSDMLMFLTIDEAFDYATRIVATIEKVKADND